MVEIKKIKITKKSYNFEIRKRYTHSRHYKIKQKKPIEKIQEAIAKIFQPKQKEISLRATAQEIQKPKPGFNPIVIIAAIFFAIAIIGGAWLYFTLNTFTLMAQSSSQDNPYLNTTILSADIATVGDIYSNEQIAYVTTFMPHAGLKNVTVTFSIYKERLQSEVFVLKSEREDAETKLYPQFIRALRKKLSDKGFLLNEIDLEQLESIPKGAIVLVPTGSVPQELLGVDSKVKIKNLLDKGSVILYIGKAFTKGMVTGNGNVVPTPQTIISANGFSFNEQTQLTVGDGFHVSQPLYRASGSFTSGSSGFGAASTKNELAYGFLSIIKYKEGAFLFIPQTLDSAWENADIAAEDVMRIISDVPWATKINDPVIYKFNETNNLSENFDFFSEKFKSSEKPQSARLEITAYMIDNIKQERIKIADISKKTQGDLYVSGGEYVAPTDITGTKVRMNAKPKGNSSEEKFLSLLFTKGGQEVGERAQIEGSRNVQTETTIDVGVHLDSGEYVVHLIDDENNEYAQTYIKVVSVDIISAGWISETKHLFYIEKGGAPVKIKKIDVGLKIDDNKQLSESFTGVSNITVDIGKATGGEKLKPKQTPYIFTFKIGKLTKTVPMSITRSPSLVEEPLFIGSILFGAIILGVGFYFAKQDEIVFLLDIPDFPPVSKTKIALNPETIISVFEKVNEDYRWRYTPLTPIEVKNGFKKILYQGKPIFISDYNTEFILKELLRGGDVKESLGYYGPMNWEKKAGHNVKYLALLRRIRDICVNNAVPFTQLGEAETCDSEITCVGQQMYLHVYDSSEAERIKEIVKKAMKSIKSGITIILFKDELEKKDFVTVLASPSQAMLSLKLENEAKSVLLLTAEEFEKMIKELKEI